LNSGQLTGIALPATQAGGSEARRLLVCHAQAALQRESNTPQGAFVEKPAD
jgi:hypothetical protein